MKDDNQNKFIAQLAIDTKFFISHLPNLVQGKTKGAVGAVCTLLRKARRRPLKAFHSASGLLLLSPPWQGPLLQ
jgi:hypothetical protein